MSTAKVNQSADRKTKRTSRSRDLPSKQNERRNDGYGVRKNSLSRSVTDISNTVLVDPTSAARRTSVCYESPVTASTETERNENTVDPEAEITAKYRFIKAVEEVIKTPAQSAGCRREYAKMKEEMETKASVSRNEIIIVGERRILPMQKVQSEPKIASFPFATDDETDGIIAPPCQHEICQTAPIITRNNAGTRLCLLEVVAHMKHLASKRPKNKQQLKKNPITTADEKLLREITEVEEKKMTGNTGHAHSDNDTNEDIFAYVRDCRYLRGVEEMKELSIEEIFH